MNGLRIMLNSGKRFVCSASHGRGISSSRRRRQRGQFDGALRPQAHPHWSCSTTDYPTISAAVGAAASGDIIMVGPGTYHRVCDHQHHSLSLFGAQAGRDAREDRDDPRKESIVEFDRDGVSRDYHKRA